MPDARKAMVVTLVLALLAGIAIWLLVFDMWLGQVERQYLYENAAHELQRGPAVSLKAMTDQARIAGAQVATGWSVMVMAAIGVAGRYCYVRGRVAGMTTWTR